MPTTIAGALRVPILATGDYGDARVWDSRAPKSVSTWPYVTIADGIDMIPALEGDAQVTMLERIAQVDLWEKGDDEDAAIARRLFDALNGATLELGESRICRVRVASAVRIFEVDTNIAHRAFTLSIKHDPSAF